MIEDEDGKFSKDHKTGRRAPTPPKQHCVFRWAQNGRPCLVVDDGTILYLEPEEATPLKAKGVAERMGLAFVPTEDPEDATRV